MFEGHWGIIDDVKAPNVIKFAAKYVGITR